MFMKKIICLALLFLGGALNTATISGWQNWPSQLVGAARSQVGKTVQYNPAYKSISYPNGDVPIQEGVCTDVIIRAFRSLGIDLQKLVHEDMQKNWSQYPKLWGLKKTDKNIDHRRVPNLAKFFTNIKMTIDPENYLPGDIVIWDLGSGVLHIGILSDHCEAGTQLVLHNISSGVKEEDILHTFKIVKKFRLNAVASKRLKQIQGLQ